MASRACERCLGFVFLLLASTLVIAEEQTVADENRELRQRIEHLEQELAKARERLAEVDSQEEGEVQPVALEEPEPPKQRPVRIGGALGIHYAYGDYEHDGSFARRNEDLGDVDLDIFRLNADIESGNYIGRIEYRWYDQYSMMHTAWLGYDSEQYGTFKAGIVRVPFGPGPWGVSTSWFFDQHYYVGLSDDMDLGVRWTKSYGDLTVDVAYYVEDEGEWDGTRRDSARYSYDLVTWDEQTYYEGELDSEGVARSEGDVKWGEGESGFEEDGQLNLRVLYATENLGTLGASFQYGWLKGKNVDDSGADHYAISAHAENSFGNFTLASQISYYKYDITDDTPWGTGDLIPMGAFNFAWPVASEGWVPALSLRYNGIDTSGIPWLDSVMPYLEWSSILKERSDFNDSTLWTLGALWYWGNLYIYTDLGISDGNYFVGDKGDTYSNIYDSVGDFGANGNDRWKKRFNINARYYFSLFQ